MRSNFGTFEASPDADEVRRETLRGDTYVVAPVVMVREGVLNGGFLPAEEIERSTPGWDGRPVTTEPEAPIHGAADEPSGHPIDENGDFASANQSPYLETHVIGHLQNTEFVPDISGLRSEAWINVERAREVGENAVEVLRRLGEGDPLDVSTGYWHGFKQQAGRHEGDPYERVQFDLMPDHLAMLPNETGACSWPDGCGVPRVNRAIAGATDTEGVLTALTADDDTMHNRRAGLYEGSANARASPRTPDYSGTNPGSRDEWSEIDLSFEAFVEAYADDAENVSEVDDLSASDRTAIANRSLNGNDDANDFNELVVLPVVVPSTDELHEGGLLAAKSQAPQTEGINVEETQSRIDSLLESEFDRDTGNSQSIAQAVGNAVHSTLAAMGVSGSATDADRTGANHCDCHTMNDDQISALAGLTDYSTEELDAMGDEELAEVMHGLDAGDGAGNSTAQNDGGGDDAGSGDVPEWAESLQSEIESLRDEIDDVKAAANRDPDLDRKIDHLASNTDHDRDEIESWPDEAIDAAAESAGYGGYAGQAADRVNYVGGAGGRQPSANDDDTDEDQLVEDTATIGALTNMNGGEGGD